MTVDERISAELRRHAPEVDEHAAWEQIRSAASVGRRSRAVRLVAVPVAAAAVLLVGSILISNLSSAPDPLGSPQGPFGGTWVTIDTDGSTPTATIEVSTDGVIEIVVVDDFASVCSGAPSTMTGTGRLEGNRVLVIPMPVLTCDDGSQPEALSGPPLEEQLENLTFTLDPGTDSLLDNLGGLWIREGAERPNSTGAGWWPQSNPEEVKKAQEAADAGDPDYTWQLDPKLAADERPWGAEIFARFIAEELGWEDFVGGWDGSGHLSMGLGGGVYQGVTFIRCVPGQTNPLSPLFGDAPLEIRRCAPTIDELRYETVSIDVSQPGRRGPSGIWVVDGWELRQSKSTEPGALFGLLYPEFDGQVEQAVPPAEAEVTALLEAFLDARVNGERAEQYLLREPEGSPFEEEWVPLLYATTGGTGYERFEIEKVQGPVWPTGWSAFKVRLFAEDETVVEQMFQVVRQDRQLGLVYGYTYDGLPTTENGQSVPVPFSFLGGEVTFAAAPPWGHWGEGPTFMSLHSGRNQNVVVAADPLPMGTGCEGGPAAGDAEALARSIMAGPDFETIDTAPVRIGGVDGLQLDVAVANADPCFWGQWVLEIQPTDGAGYAGWRMRLYLIDYPGESARVLTIAVIAPQADFDRVLEEATAIVESLQIHTR